MNIAPGQKTTLTAAPLDAAGAPTTLPAGDKPNWGVEPTANVTIVPSLDGLSLDVSMMAAATPGDYVFTIVDGQNPNAKGSFTLTIPAPGPNPVASFSITASTPV